MQVVVFSRGRRASSASAACARAVGFLVRDVDSDALVRSLHGVLRGEAAVSRSLALKIVQHLRDMPDAGRGMRPVSSPLTPREWQVLDLLCSERTNGEIAGDRGLSADTVRTT